MRFGLPTFGVPFTMGDWTVRVYPHADKRYSCKVTAKHNTRPLGLNLDMHSEQVQSFDPNTQWR